MSYGIILEVWGPCALFTRPEMKVERVSYDMMTPSAARAIVEAIHWKPAIKWNITRIHVLNEILFSNIKRNEVSEKIPIGNINKAIKSGDLSKLWLNVTDSRQQRFTMALKDVHYVIEAEFELTDKASADDTPEKHIEIARRRMRKGQTFNQPYFGCREFSANFRFMEDPAAIPKGFYANRESLDLGLMLYDIDYANQRRPMFFNAVMEQGVVDVKNSEVLR